MTYLSSTRSSLAYKNRVHVRAGILRITRAAGIYCKLAGAGFVLVSPDAPGFASGADLLFAAGSLRICAKYCCTYCWYASGTSSRLISPPASACAPLRSEYCVFNCCLPGETYTITSPVMLAARLPIISLSFPMAANSAASRAALSPSCLPMPLLPSGEFG